MKTLILFATALFLLNNTGLAQSTETFETETGITFTDNGQPFNITSQAQGPFDVQTGFPGFGWNGTTADNRFIDNDGSAQAGIPVGFTIKTTGSIPFVLNNMWLYLADHNGNVNVSGTLTLVGKLAGSTVYTASQSSGFNTNGGVSNGFSLIDLATFGSQDNSDQAIDELVITTTNSFEYVALDAFNWKAPGPKLTPTWCGATIAGITNTLNYTSVLGASDYEILVEGPSAYSQSVVRGNPSTTFKLSMFTGISYNTTYTVKVKAKVAGVWGSYGKACNLSTPVVPGNTKLIPSDCGITLSTLDEVLEYNEIYGATNYEIWVEGPGGYSSTQLRNSSATSFRLSWFSGVKLGQTYTVKVRSFVNGSWGSFGGVACNISTPAIPLTSLVPGNCNYNESSIEEILSYTAVAGATDYEISVESVGSYSQTLLRNNNRTTFRLSWFPGIPLNEAYGVKIRSYVNGVWSAYGSVCYVYGYPAPIVVHDTPLTEGGIQDLFLETYPNPNNGEFTIQSSHEGTFRLINELGQEIQTIEFTNENGLKVNVGMTPMAIGSNSSLAFIPGIYFLTGTINNQVITKKIIVTK